MFAQVFVGELIQCRAAAHVAGAGKIAAAARLSASGDEPEL